MFAELKKKLQNASPRAAIAGLLIAIVAGSGLALLFLRGGDRAEADDTVQPIAARIDRVDGSVGIARVIDENAEPEWADATLNAPVSVGDRVYARDGSRASIALTGHNFVRMDPGTSLDVLELGDDRTQLGLRSGLALFDVGALESDDFYEVGTPYGAIDFTEPGLYQIGIDDGSAIVSVLSGLAQVVGRGGSGYINKGQVFTLVSAAAAEVLSSRLSPSLAGGIVDDYYRYRHPSTYDGRYASYDTYLEDPFYYDPYRSSVSYQYVDADIPGLYDLDSYGDWSDLDGYGQCWAPRVSAGWAPFRSGAWNLYDPWGPTWVSNEPWGWAPYHYGRWTYVQERWFWVPVEVRSRRSYSPAAVAFIPFTETNQIGWVPLAPGEVYVPRYYDANLRPRYLASREVIREAESHRTFINLNSPSAVTVVPVQEFRRKIDSSVVAQIDRNVIARSRPTLDPFAVDSVREVAMRSKGERRQMKLARADQEAINRPIITTRTPASLPGENFAKSHRVETVSGEQKRNKLKIDDTKVIADRRPDGSLQPNAPNQLRVGKDREQRGGGEPQGAQSQAQQESLRQRMKEQLRAERQQRDAGAQAQQQQRIQQQEQQRIQKQQQRVQQQQQQQQQRVQQQQQRVQQQQQKRVQQQQQQQMQNQQRKQERRKPPEAFVQQQQQQRVQQQQQRVQQQQQQRVQQQQQRVKQQQQQPVQPQQQMQNQQRVKQQQQQPVQQQNQQRKQEKRKPPEASIQQQQRVNQASQMREQARAQRAQQDGFRQQAQARQQQQQVMRQQASQAQAAQRQEIRKQEQRPQRLLGPPNPSQPQAQQRSEKGGKRKP